MNKLVVTLIGFFTIVSSFGQEEINNSKTEKHQPVAGTKFFLIPPSGFVSATSFQGFQQTNTGSSILLMEIPGPFSETTRGFNEQGLKTQGVQLKTKNAIKVNGKQGFFMTAAQSAYGNDYSKYMLVFGDAQATYMINGTFPAKFAELAEDIRNAMLSVVYESAMTVDPLGSVSFTIDTRDTKLKFAKNMSGMLIYTVDGKVPAEASDKTSFLVGLSIANVKMTDFKMTAVTRMKKLPYTDLKIDESKISEVEIDGITGYELVGEGLDKPNGTTELVYQVMLYTDNGYYIIVGTTTDNFEQNLELFKKVARTFKRK
ncbi:MAG: hypothetical protein HYZ44_10555 [Bacteroidetes bacterium]|nr:hypothetical protein [Bacteroidota bacterium]